MSNSDPVPVRRALVLGGGAILGAYWEAGLLRGLYDCGINVFDFDAIVGTSAGSMAASALANGKLPESPDLTRARRRSAGHSPEPGFPFDLSSVDPDAVIQVFQLWARMQRSTVGQCAAIGALARQADRCHAAEWMASFEESLSTYNWGKRKLFIVAVDAVSGERRVFSKHDSVAISHAVASSCALPGICPPVEIEGGFYMDGGVHSTTNADVLAAERPTQALIVMPSNAVTMKFGGFAERMLEQEVATLHAVGCDVRVATPTARDTQRFGTELMDYTRVDDAYLAGLDAGREWASALRTDAAIAP